MPLLQARSAAVTWHWPGGLLEGAAAASMAMSARRARSWLACSGRSAGSAQQWAVRACRQICAGQRHAAGQVPFAVEVARVVPAEQEALAEGDGSRDGGVAGAFGGRGHDEIVQQGF